MSTQVHSCGQRFQTLCFASLDDFKIANIVARSRRGREMVAAYIRTGELVLLKERYSNEMDVLENTLKEAETLLDLGPHRNILTIRGYAQEGTTGLIALEHLQHKDMQRQMQRYKKLSKTFSEPFLWAILLDISSALQHIHDKGYVFRDIKLANIYLREVDYTNNSSVKLDLVEPNKQVRIANLQFVLSNFESCRKLPPPSRSNSKLMSNQFIPSDYATDTASLPDTDYECTPGVDVTTPSQQPTISFLQALQNRIYYDITEDTHIDGRKKVMSTAAQKIYNEDHNLPYSARSPNKQMAIQKEYENVTGHMSDSTILNPEIREELRAASRSGSLCGSNYGSQSMNTSRSASRSASPSISRTASRSISRSASPSLPIPRAISITVDRPINIPTDSRPDTLLVGSYVQSASPTFRRGLTDLSNINRPDMSVPPMLSDSPGRHYIHSSRTSVSTRSQNSIDHGKFDYVQNMARFTRLDPFEKALRNHKIRKELEKRRNIFPEGTNMYATVESEDDIEFKLIKPTLGKFGTRSISQTVALRPATTSSLGKVSQARLESSPKKNPFQIDRGKSAMPKINDEEQQLRDLEELWRREEISCNPNNPNYPTKLTTTLDQCNPRARDTLPYYLEPPQNTYSTFKARSQKVLLPDGSGTITILGTPNYMPKEMAEGNNITAMDIYALGVSVLELMCLEDYQQIDMERVQKQLSAIYSRDIRTLVLRMLGPPDLRPSAEDIHESSLRAILTHASDYGATATLTHDDVIYERGCKTIPSLKHPLHIDLEALHQREYLRRRPPYSATHVPEDSTDVIAPHLLEHPFAKNLLDKIRHIPPQVCSLKTQPQEHFQPVYVEYNNEQRVVEQVELPLHRTAFKGATMAKYLERLSQNKPPLYSFNKAASRKIVDPPEKWMPNPDSVLSEFGPEAQIKRLQSEQTPDLLEVLDTGIHSIPNARGGRRLTSEKYSKMVRPKTATSIPLRRDSSGHSSESSTFKANHDAERRRPRISVAFGAITMPNAPSSDRRVITD
ncbi:Kinase, NEK [Giardia duodenalis]|uniref:non-specific serine/threonine protein kinase n=1 Tax=Giardia intestinalis (strain ATCC 50803 / WB clone C6) TaxID=184922 RepID=A8BG39_GIAIC|nr:Kinase, NEK [Giardia intestinalis]KAE8302225.1 Kinase, NEK [Giardia intestinalis]|eukprot:XP_001707124.1 Kinase, NEK [Giardia lamblia ATCC 50803]